MREIKFRAWDGFAKRMKPVTRTVFGRNGNEFYVQHGEVGEALVHEVHVMQFTGLTCNGHEWYEGDILENDTDWYQVAWDEDDARWEAIGIRGTHNTLVLSELLSQETWVQGNVFESRELLKP